MNRNGRIYESPEPVKRTGFWANIFSILGFTSNGVSTTVKQESAGRERREAKEYCREWTDQYNGRRR